MPDGITSLGDANHQRRDGPAGSNPVPSPYEKGGGNGIRSERISHHHLSCLLYSKSVTSECSIGSTSF